MSSLSPNTLIRHKQETPFGLVEVVDTNKERLLYVNDCCQGRVSLSNYYPSSWYVVSMLRFCKALMPGAALCLGGGPFVIPKWLDDKGWCVTVVEQNSALTKVARDYFGYHGPDPFLMDAKNLLAPSNTYELVVLDLYNGFDGGDFYKPEYISKLKKTLKPNGYLLVNKIVDGNNVVEIHNSFDK